MDSHYQDLILVDLLGMLHQHFLEDGWVWEPCFLSAAVTLKRALLITNHGHLEQRFIFNAMIVLASTHISLLKFPVSIELKFCPLFVV